MACSEARLTANRANAARSTGPKTPEGKAASRLNAWRHGLAGRGDLVGPGEDASSVARRAAAFRRELGASGEAGRVLAERAALLSIRMQRLADRELVTVATDVEAARAQFDGDRWDAIGAPIETIEAGGAGVRPALQQLEATPEGISYLLDAWQTVQDQIRSDDPAERQHALGQAVAWLGLPGNPEAGEVAARVREELVRLGKVRTEMAALVAEVALARTHAGVLASFDPSPAATLARRYEAAAERGFFRALRELAAQHRPEESDLEAPGQSFISSLEAVSRRIPAPTAGPALLPSPAARGLAPAPVATPGRPGGAAAAAGSASLAAGRGAPALGSFRAATAGAAATGSHPLLGAVEPGLIPTPRPKARPDLRKLAARR